MTAKPSETPRTDTAAVKNVQPRWSKSLADWRIHCLIKEGKKLERELLAAQAEIANVPVLIAADPDVAELIGRLNDYAANPSIVYGFIPVFPNTLREAAAALQRQAEELAEERSANELNRDAYLDAKTRADKAEEQLAAKQEKIDRLMLEYCSDEMTPEQMAEWERHQKAFGRTGSIDAAQSGGQE
jgi:hypothetical protein